MLRFFSKKRWRLAADNQFFKYSRYAIGEIVLVVIGILIALYINNWNEERKAKQLTLTIFKEIQSDLIRTLNEFQTANESYNIQYLWTRRVLLDKVDEADYRENPFVLDWIIFISPESEIRKNGFEKLNNSMIQNPKEYNQTLNELIELYKMLELTEKLQDQMKTLTMANHEKLADSQDWYSEENWQSNEALDYFLNDPSYKNMVRKFHNSMFRTNLFDDMDAIVRNYISLSEITGVNELPTNFRHLQNQNLDEFQGIYKWKDSADIPSNRREITLGQGSLIYPHNDPPFYEIAKDSFVSLCNNTLVFKRDSNDQIIGAMRNLVGESFELEKIE